MHYVISDWPFCCFDWLSLSYDLEKWPAVPGHNCYLPECVDRHHFDARVTDQDMVESFLPSFESCVRDAHVASIMCSYNSVNGVPSCANDYLLQDLLRDDWSLSGFVVSDCDAVEDIFDTHNYTKTAAEAVAVALNAGTDVDCGGFYQKHLQDALNQGLTNTSALDQALVRSIGTLVRAGWFDPAESQPYRQLGPKDVNTDKSQQLALQAARAGIALLKNTASPVATAMTLPWSAAGGKTIAIVGPLFNSTKTYLGNYYGA
jgi:beta-D-xylosidase 4